MVVCIDTNVILDVFGRARRWTALRDALLAGRLRWAISTEILLEYEEVAAREMGPDAAKRLMRFIELADQTRGVIRHVSPSFRFGVIDADSDDNNFADCAIAASAEYIVTNDHHFAAMAGSGYKPQPISPQDFIDQHLGTGPS